MKFILIYVTHKNMQDAEKLTSHLLDERLIACANFFPVASQYWWKGKIEKSDEIVSILKTRKDNWGVVREYVEKNHPYETPCVIKMSEVESNDSYAAWIEAETK